MEEYLKKKILGGFLKRFPEVIPKRIGEVISRGVLRGIWKKSQTKISENPERIFVGNDGNITVIVPQILFAITTFFGLKIQNMDGLIYAIWRIFPLHFYM